MTNTHTSVVISKTKTLTHDIFWICFGVIALIAGSEIRIPLPWTPVPITLQTFVVVFLALHLPLRRALSAVAVYLFLGGIGVPIFSGWTSSLLRPTAGYLIGFFVATIVLGALRDRLLKTGVIRGIAMTYLINDCIICAIGMVWLYFWTGVPATQLVFAGWLPFIPGGIVKTTAAYLLAKRLN